MTTPATIPRTASTKKIPEGMKSSASNRKSPAPIRTKARVKGCMPGPEKAWNSKEAKREVVEPIAGVRWPAADHVGRWRSYFLHYDPIALNFDDLDAGARLNVAPFGYNIKEIVRETRFS